MDLLKKISFRWIVDIAVINGLENKVFAKNDFIRTESYVIRLKTKGIEKLMELLNTQFAIIGVGWTQALWHSGT